VTRKRLVPVPGLKDQAETGPVIREITDMTLRALMGALVSACPGREKPFLCSLVAVPGGQDL
jgi:hypothetical protein